MYVKNKIKNMKVVSLFSGMGSQEKAMENLNIIHELINYCEIDKYSSKTYSLIHGVSENLNLKDVTKVDPTLLTDFDLMTYGFPCTDISTAGKMEGFKKGANTRSSLLWDAMRIVEEKNPKFLFAENVKNLVGKKFKEDFNEWISYLDSIGYNSYYKILDANYFGVPQHRERVYIISIRKDIDKGFEFPKNREITWSLKDILLDKEEVELKDFFNSDYLKHKQNQNRWGNNFANRDSKRHPTLLAIGRSDVAHLTDDMRHITARECFRLMGFTDADYFNVKDYIPEGQLYKQCGNSIVVNAVQAIFEKLIEYYGEYFICDEKWSENNKKNIELKTVELKDLLIKKVNKNVDMAKSKIDNELIDIILEKIKLDLANNDTDRIKEILYSIKKDKLESIFNKIEVSLQKEVKEETVEVEVKSEVEVDFKEEIKKEVKTDDEWDW